MQLSGVCSRFSAARAVTAADVIAGGDLIVEFARTPEAPVIHQVSAAQRIGHLQRPGDRRPTPEPQSGRARHCRMCADEWRRPGVTCGALAHLGAAIGWFAAGDCVERLDGRPW
jgi:hypothetical protein